MRERDQELGLTPLHPPHSAAAAPRVSRSGARRRRRAERGGQGGVTLWGGGGGGGRGIDGEESVKQAALGQLAGINTAAHLVNRNLEDTWGTGAV